MHYFEHHTIPLESKDFPWKSKKFFTKNNESIKNKFTLTIKTFFWENEIDTAVRTCLPMEVRTGPTRKGAFLKGFALDRKFYQKIINVIGNEHVQVLIFIKYRTFRIPNWFFDIISIWFCMALRAETKKIFSFI